MATSHRTRRSTKGETCKFDGPGYLRVLGLAPADRMEALARTERVAASVATR